MRSLSLLRRLGFLAIAVAIAGCVARTPTAAPARLLSPTPAGPSDYPVVDPDDGATIGDAGPLPSPAGTTDPSAPASGRLPGEPDPALTPGAVNPAVTQATIATTICLSGWTSTVRPPSSYTTALKIQQITEYGYADTSTADYEEDHLIPLELGGAPSDAANLWPEPYTATLPDGRNVGARVKDQLENSLRRDVCAGTLTLVAAQAEIGIHWVHTYYGIPLATAGATPSTPPVPTAEPSASPSPTAAPSTPLSITKVSLTTSVARGGTASVSIKTAAGAYCTIVVTYNSGPSSAAGLGPKTASSTGGITWSWKVGTRTALGSYPIDINCSTGGQTGSLSLSFRVT